MGFFGKSKKVAPQVGKPHQVKSDNYLDSKPETFYLCLPNDAEFVIENTIQELSAKLFDEHQFYSPLNNQIEKVRNAIRVLNRILNKSAGLVVGDILAADAIKNYENILQKLLLNKTQHQSGARHYILRNKLFKTPVDALKAAIIKYPQSTFSILQLKIPHGELNVDILKGKEVTRPDLLKYVEAVKTVSDEDNKKILAVLNKNSKKIFFKKSREKESMQIIQEIFDNAKEYKKSLIETDPPTDKISLSSYRNSNSKNKSSHVHILPTIPEGVEEPEDSDKFCKIIKIDSKVSVRFDEVERSNLSLEISASQSNRSSKS